MTEPSAGISCETCVALCCHAPVNMIMTKSEYRRHRRTMDLEVLVEPSPSRQRVGPAGDKSLELPAGHGLFELVSGCANLTEDHRCSIYTTRPNCCRDFAVGSSECLKLRRDAGLDANIELADEQRAFAPRPLELDEVRATVAAEASWIAEQLRSIPLRVWTRRTRCSGWDVGTLVAHVVGVLQFAHAALAATVEGTAARAPEEFRTKGAAAIAAFDDAVQDVEVVLNVLAPSDIRRDVTIDDTTVSVEYLVQVLVMELAVHACDLADAMRSPRRLGAEAVRAAANVVPDLLDSGEPPTEARSYLLISDAFALPFTFRGGAWVNEVGDNPCTIQGDAEAVVLFALGRVQFDVAVFRTSHAGAARAFKRHLVGP